MPSARALHCKSGLPPAHTLRVLTLKLAPPLAAAHTVSDSVAFHFDPYCFAHAAATHIVQATHNNAQPKPAQTSRPAFRGRVLLLSLAVNRGLYF